MGVLVLGHNRRDAPVPAAVESVLQAAGLSATAGNSGAVPSDWCEGAPSCPKQFMFVHPSVDTSVQVATNLTLQEYLEGHLLGNGVSVFDGIAVIIVLPDTAVAPLVGQAAMSRSISVSQAPSLTDSLQAVV